MILIITCKKIYLKYFIHSVNIRKKVLIIMYKKGII